MAPTPTIPIRSAIRLPPIEPRVSRDRTLCPRDGRRADETGSLARVTAGTPLGTGKPTATPTIARPRVPTPAAPPRARVLLPGGIPAAGYRRAGPIMLPGSYRYRSGEATGEGAQMTTTPIADYALLSDRHSAALVSRDGSIDWLCFPRFDSPSIFGRLLGDEAGHWSMSATAATEVTRRYLDRTMVLETTFRTSTGTVAITDALAMGEGNRGHELGKGAPHVLLRRATCVEGEVELSLEYVPRPEYGLVHPLLDAVDGGVTAFGGADVLVLSSPVALTVDQSAASGQLQLHRGESAGFALHHAKRAETGLGQGLDSIRDRPPVGGHRVGVGVVVEAPPGLRGPVARPGAPKRPGAAGTLVRTHRRDLRGGHDVAARGGRGHPKLGLPLRLGPGRFLHDRGPVGGGLP